MSARSPDRAQPRRSWSRFRYPDTLVGFGIQLAVLVFIGYSAVHLDVKFERLAELFSRVWSLLAERYWPPSTGLLTTPRYLRAVLDTVEMAYLGLVFGVLLAAPLAWCAARNVTPGPRLLYPAARLIVMACRAVHEMIWTILFVSILGFGMLAGVLALTLFCIGFAAKLFAEEVEAIDPGPVEAMRASGANELQVFVFAVLPQVRVAWTGITIYTWDVAFRAATVVGFFGAGGMGWYLQRYVQQLDNQRVAAVLLSIVALVLVSEIASAVARARIARSG
ncbi:MAG: phosphonate ABC transporter, permease protein PhnE [Alphaproteobacteria bacterium]|nr:phosphonate ABC transporter, permease protein PhnE [Alphaproteobacteria bacterium]